MSRNTSSKTSKLVSKSVSSSEEECSNISLKASNFIPKPDNSSNSAAEDSEVSARLAAIELAKKVERKRLAAITKRLMDQRRALKNLCSTIVCIFSNYRRVAKIGGDKESPPETFAKKYLEKVNIANYKFEPHRDLFLEIYADNSEEFLTCARHYDSKNLLWLDLKKVDCHLGKGTGWAKQNIMLKISMAYKKSILMRQIFDEKLENTKNDDDKDEIRLLFEYSMYAELMANLLNVIIFALEAEDLDHEDLPKIRANFEYYTELKNKYKSTSEEEEKAKNNASESMKKLGGTGMSGMADMMSSFTSVFSDGGFMEAAEKKISAIQNMDKDGKMDVKGVMSIMTDGMEDFIPSIESAVEGMKGKISGDKPLKKSAK